jgi:hypothetical protein
MRLTGVDYSTHAKDYLDELMIKGNCYSSVPTWQVSEPFLNLWLACSPLNYQPALGYKVAPELYYKQRDQRQRNLRLSDMGSTGNTNSTRNLSWGT